MESKNEKNLVGVTPALTPALATRMARLALKGIAQEYPNVLERFANRSYPVPSPPHQLHPAFYGCYDWHSAVHSHWMLIRLLRSVPHWSEARLVRQVLDRHLTAANLQAEVLSFGSSQGDTGDQTTTNPAAPTAPIFPRFPASAGDTASNTTTSSLLYSLPGQSTFERPYGWAWLLQLVAELYDWDDPQGQSWLRHLQPLAERMVELFTGYLERLPQPDLVLPRREGLHTNTAFALGLALAYARKCGRPAFERLIVARGLDFYGPDRAAPAHQEPGPTDFLSSSLIEADFMSRVLPAQNFALWFNQFLPTIEYAQPASLLQPVFVSDHADPYICHLDGLNLSRAWCFYRIAHALPAELPVRNILLQAARAHSHEGLDHIFEGNFQSTGHWLCTFAVYLLTLSLTP